MHDIQREYRYAIAASVDLKTLGKVRPAFYAAGTETGYVRAQTDQAHCGERMRTIELIVDLPTLAVEIGPDKSPGTRNVLLLGSTNIPTLDPPKS